jgi:hypothetical protein
MSIFVKLGAQVFNVRQDPRRSEHFMFGTFAIYLQHLAGGKAIVGKNGIEGCTAGSEHLLLGCRGLHEPTRAAGVAWINQHLDIPPVRGNGKIASMNVPDAV